MLRGSHEKNCQHTFVSQILYPTNTLFKLRSHAYLIGWNLENFRCCISSVIECPTGKYDELSSSLNSASLKLAKLFSTCSKGGHATPVILGEWIPRLETGYLPHISRRTDNIWITLTGGTDSPHPKLHSLYSLGYLYNTSCYLFQYDIVDTDRLSCLIVGEDKLPSRSLSQGGKQGYTQSELDFIVAQVNASQDLDRAVHQCISDRRTDTDFDDKYHNVAYRLVSKAYDSLCAVLAAIVVRLAYVWHAIMRKAIVMLNHRYTLCSLGPIFAHWLGLRGSGGIQSLSGGLSPPPSTATQSSSSSATVSGDGPLSNTTAKKGSALDSAEGISLCDISLAAAYLSERTARFDACLRKCALFPSAWLLPAQLRQSLWMSVFSFLFVLWVDVLLGCVAGHYLYSNAERLVPVMEKACHNAQKHFIIDGMRWFNHSPGGVKLNPLITTRVGAALEAAVNAYHTVLVDTRPVHLPVVQFVACFGCLGVTAQLVLLVDVMRLVTLHIATIHRVLSTAHEWQIQLVYSLYLLFRGQKRNILRRREDTCEHDQTQLLFGIVLFSVALFFFPSFAAFYYLFAFAQFCVVFLQYLLWSSAVAVKEFPLYALLVRLSAPRTLTSGVQFDILRTGAAGGVDATNKAKTTAESSGGYERKTSRSDRCYDAAPDVQSDREREPLLSVYETADEGDFGKNGEISHSVPLRAVENAPVPAVKGILKSKRSHSSTSVGAAEAAVTYEDEANLAMERHELVTADLHAQGAPLQVSFNPRVDADDGQEGLLLKTDVMSSRGRARSTSDEAASEEEVLHDAQPVDSVYDFSNNNNNSVSIISPGGGGGRAMSAGFGRLSGGGGSLSGTSMTPFRPLDTTTRSKEPRNFNATGSSNSHSDVVHLRLRARIVSVGELFSGYAPYLRYVVSEQGFVMRILRGICLGRPALDIQLIHATAALGLQRSRAEQEEISSAFATADAVLTARQSSSSQAPLKTRLQGDDGSKHGRSTTSGSSTGFATSCFRRNNDSLSGISSGGGGVREPGGVRDMTLLSSMKQRKNSGSMSELKAMPYLSASVDGLALPGTSSRVVYDLPQSGSVVLSGFWESVTLARGDPEAVFRQTTAGGEEEEADGDAMDTHSGRVLKSSSTGQSRRLSRWMLFSLLTTSMLSLLLFTCGATLTVVSILPSHWQRNVLSAYRTVTTPALSRQQYLHGATATHAAVSAVRDSGEANGSLSLRSTSSRLSAEVSLPASDADPVAYGQPLRPPTQRSGSGNNNG